MQQQYPIYCWQHGLSDCGTGEEDFFTDYDEDYGYEDIYGDSFDEDFDEFYTDEFVFEDDDSEFEYEDFNDFAEEEYASLEVYVFAGETYYILIADATLPSPNQQAENESFRTEYELPPAGGLLVLRSDFIADAGYDVTADATEGGSVQTGSVGPYPEGTTITITAIADSGWVFDRWVGDTADIADPTANPVQFQVFDDLNITAHFLQQTVVEEKIYLPLVNK